MDFVGLTSFSVVQVYQDGLKRFHHHWVNHIPHWHLLEILWLLLKKPSEPHPLFQYINDSSLLNHRPQNSSKFSILQILMKGCYEPTWCTGPGRRFKPSLSCLRTDTCILGTELLLSDLLMKYRRTSVYESATPFNQMPYYQACHRDLNRITS